MGDMYANASSVTAWLGNATATSEVVLGGLSRVDDRNAINEECYTAEELRDGHPIHSSLEFHLRAAMKEQNSNLEDNLAPWPVLET
jgi:hypothetical protein